MSAKALAVGALSLNALVWGLCWWPLRALESQGLHPLWSTAIIYVFVLLGLSLLRARAWRSFIEHPMLWWLVLSSGLTNVGFNWAVTVGDVVRVVLLFYLMPAWSVLLAWPLLGEKPSVGSLFRLTLALVGVVIVLKTPATPWPVPESLADWLALMGGFCFALTNVLLRKLNHTPTPARTLAMFGGGAVMATGVALIGMRLGVVNAPPAPDLAWLGLALLMGAAFFGGNLALQYGAGRLRASTTSLIMLSEVLFASVSSVLLSAGVLTLRTALGGALILLASLLALLPSRKH